MTREKIPGHYVHTEAGRANIADVLDEMTSLLGTVVLPTNLLRKVSNLQEELIFERDRREGTHAR